MSKNKISLSYPTVAYSSKLRKRGSITGGLKDTLVQF
jgi:hypothetical protein